MALIIKGKKPTGCFDCDYCDKRAYFDGNEWHLGCRLLCMEVSDDGETDERCPIIGEIPDKHGDLKDEIDIIHRIEKIADADLAQDIIGEILASPTIVEATE